MQLSDTTLKLLLRYQQEELMGYEVYKRLAKREKDPANKKMLNIIANEELDHARTWQSYTQKETKPNRLRVFWFSLLSAVMGFTFVIKLMEKGEYATSRAYRKLIAEIPEAEGIMEQEQTHEAELGNMLNEERLNYVGAMVLGLNDALVELTGTIAGLTFALANTRLIALSGIITGVSATLSMAASNYLAERASDNPKALKSSLYTGAAYLVTVVLMVLPFLLFPPGMHVAALLTMLAVVVLVILFFNFYIAVAKSESFGRRFLEMFVISMGVAVISFGIGLLAKRLLGIDI